MRAFSISALVLMATAPMLGSASNDPVLGRLGQALRESSIHTSASTRGRVLYRVKAYEYLIVRESRNGWTPVVMENGRLGYIQTNRVAVLPYNVTASRTFTNRGTGQQPSRSGSSSASQARAQIAQYALNYEGTPYRWGGNDMRRGIDCSAFVQQLFGRIGVELPRTAAQQALVGKRIERLEDLEPGDRLYFWDRRRGRVGHTGIYLGNGFFVHSSVNNRGVATDDLREPRWRNTLVAARR